MGTSTTGRGSGSSEHMCTRGVKKLWFLVGHH